MLRRLALLAAVALLLAPAARAQQKRLTLDDLFDPQKKLDFGHPPTRGAFWLDDAHFAWPKLDEKAHTTEWLKVDAQSGGSEPLFDAARMQAALAGLPGVGAEEAKRLTRLPRYTWNDAHTALALEIADDLYLYEPGADHATRLTFTPGEEREAAFSPDGRSVAFVREHNLYVVDVKTQRERSLTSDGSDDVLNGELDWVYQEEIFGRGRFRAFWWSPDSSRIAFLRLDEHAVPRYTLVNDVLHEPEVEHERYPKAGDPNPTVKLGVAGIAGGPARFVDLDKYAPVEFLIVDAGWTRDGKQLCFEVQDREQTWLDLDLADAAKGELSTLLRETTPAWVDNHGEPVWLEDGSFLWLSERSGFEHIYHYKGDGTLIGPVTSGRWEVRALHGVDEAKGYVYFSGTERSPIGGDVYRVKLDGSSLERLSQAEGTHSATFNPSLTLYLDAWSDVMTPTEVRLHRADGKELRVVDENKAPALAALELRRPEFLKVKTRDGFEMEAMLLKPPDFDASRKYPVYQHTYGGPHAPQVRNAWSGTLGLYHQLLAQKGLVVWICDNRSASGKGIEPTWTIYKHMGEGELRDVEDGLAWLKRQPWVDASRIGINGWSYGGFMVTYALTHSKSFAMGIAGGPVTSWRNYDSVYTERYMLMPQRNPDGYARTAPQAAAKDLHGKLLLIHGAIDDNVHPQNTLQLAYELQQAGKPFRMMLYPRSRHGVTDPLLVKHMREMMLGFVEETLLAPARH